VLRSECTGTSVTLWTKDLHYKSLVLQRPWIRSLLVLHLEICQQSRLWECGNPAGISKECGKHGKPVSWLSMLSILCHFHGLLWKRASHNQNPAEAVLSTRTVPRTASMSALAMTHKSRRISGHKPVSAPSTPGSSASFANRALLSVRIRETLLKPLLVNALASRETFAAPERRLSTYVNCRSERHQLATALTAIPYRARRSQTC